MMNCLKFLSILLLIPQVCFGGASRDFNGSTGYLDLGNTSSGSDLKPTATPITFSIWIKPDIDTSRLTMLSSEETTARGYAWHFMGSVGGDPFEGGFFRPTTYPVLQYGTGAKDIWQFVAFSWAAVHPTNPQYRGWLNANAYSSTPGITNTEYGSSSVKIGRYAASGANYVDGKMSYFHFYRDKELSFAEVQEIRFKPGMVGGVTSFLPIWGSSSPEIDLSGRGNTGALSGTADESFDGPPVMFGGGLPL